MFVCIVCVCWQLDAVEVGVHRFGDFEVEVFDSSSDYVSLLKSIFDFPALRTFLARPDFQFAFDGMHGGTSSSSPSPIHPLVVTVGIQSPFTASIIMMSVISTSIHDCHVISRANPH